MRVYRRPRERYPQWNVGTVSFGGCSRPTTGRTARIHQGLSNHRSNSSFQMFAHL
jgi:hypothetical protein